MVCGPIVKTWTEVPDGSKLELRLVGTDDDFGVDICLRVDDVPGDDCAENWTREEVWPGPKKHRLVSPLNYQVDILIKFLGEKTITVEVEARICTADGTLHQEVFSSPHSGRRGEACHNILAILTQ